MSEPGTAAPGPIASGPHRVHASYVVLKALHTLKEMWVALLALAIPAIRSASELPPRVSFIGLGVIFALAVLGIVDCAFISYRRFEWELTEGALHVRQGIVVGSTRTSPSAAYTHWATGPPSWTARLAS